jgi:NADH-quinone oxidoreductase subunit N
MNDLWTTLGNDLWLIQAQMHLTVFGIGILISDHWLGLRQKWLNAALAMAGVIWAGYDLWAVRDKVGVGFANAVQVDPFYIFFGFLFLASTALVILLSVRYLEIEAEHHAEYYALMLFATVGMLFMAAGMDLVTLFIGLETMALSFYVLAGFLRSDKRSNEGALKYLLLGAFSSGILAYGFSLLYGISGSTNLLQIQSAVAARPENDLLVLLALTTVSAGLFFKIAAVPFHQWAPDVYEGSPTSITAYLSVASKAASFALLLRIFLVPFLPVRPNWELLLTVVAVASLTIGNFAAITQTNVKRLLAYSSIAHVGYILLGIVAGNETGMKGVAFYLFAYTFMNTGAFAVVILLRRKGLIGDTLEDMNGLFHRNTGAAVLMLIFLLSLAGIPPTAGFVGKFFILWALIETRHYLLAILGAVYIVPALYYYWRIVVAMWITESRDTGRPVITPAQGLALAAAVVISLVAGVFPDPFIRLAEYSYSLFLPLGR